MDWKTQGPPSKGEDEVETRKFAATTRLGQHHLSGAHDNCTGLFLSPKEGAVGRSSGNIVSQIGCYA